MKKASLRQRLPAWFLAAALILAAVWSYWTLASCHEAAAAEADNLQASRRFAAQIKKLREKPLRADIAARSATEVARVIEAAAKKANIPPTSLVQIDPQPARRLGNSAYQEQPTLIELRDVNLRQLLILVDALTGEESNAELAELRLSAPRDLAPSPSGEETWTVEMTLTHLIFAP